MDDNSIYTPNNNEQDNDNDYPNRRIIYWLKSLDTTNLELTNQKACLYTLGTSIIYSPMSSSSLISYYFKSLKGRKVVSSFIIEN